MIDSQGVARILKTVAATIQEHRDYLTALDSAIGDADHGHNMAKGFDAVLTRVLASPDPDLGKLLQQVGMTLVTTVGGASGPLYGTAFMRMGALLAGREGLSLAELPRVFAEAVAGVQQRGRAERGDKTMLDALIPAGEALTQAVSDGLPAAECLRLAADAAEAGAEYTKTIKALKGRASYLGDRSIGHRDPGATSSALILQAVYRSVSGE